MTLVWQQGGTIWVGAALHSAEIEVRVRDNGKGTERDTLEKVFDLFALLDSTKTVFSMTTEMPPTV